MKLNYDDYFVTEKKMASNGNGEFSFARGNGTVANGNGTARNGLAKIQTQKKDNGVCHDDSTPPVKAQTIDELHSLQKKKSAPTTPIKGTQGGAFAVTLSEEERHKQQLQSIRYALVATPMHPPTSPFQVQINF